MRVLYCVLWWLALPLVLARLWWRGRKEPGYRLHIAERLGFYDRNKQIKQPIIWVHAVSVGETRAVEPLLTALLTKYPNHTILLTHMTPTGRATGRALFGKYAPRIVQSYLPYDIGYMVERFLKYFMPRVCVLMETEVWPNLISQCNKHNIPVALINARLSERSLKKAQRFSNLMRQAVKGISCISAQTQADAARLERLGAINVYVDGSMKFDIAPPEEALVNGAMLRKQFGNRPVLLCASTREGEEALILNALKEVQLQDALIVIVPRHPQRFDEVARLITARNLTMTRRSIIGDMNLTSDTQVLLGDSMGEMFTYYAACDIAFIGGSLLPLGGQNLIEACALGKPVLLGPYTFNFNTISDDAIATGAALRVMDATEMLREAMHLFYSDKERTTRSENAMLFAQHHRGATSKILELLQSIIH